MDEVRVVLKSSTKGGIPEDAMLPVFDRFYRGETVSR
jgi:signal transduction histidine kinase